MRARNVAVIGCGIWGKNVVRNFYNLNALHTVCDLDEVARENDKVLMVGHLLMYHPVVNRLKMLIAEGALGEIKYVQSDRLNINYFKNEIY